MSSLARFWVCCVSLICAAGPAASAETAADVRARLVEQIKQGSFATDLIGAAGPLMVAPEIYYADRKLFFDLYSDYSGNPACTFETPAACDFETIVSVYLNLQFYELADEFLSYALTAHGGRDAFIARIVEARKKWSSLMLEALLLTPSEAEAVETRLAASFEASVAVMKRAESFADGSVAVADMFDYETFSELELALGIHDELIGLALEANDEAALRRRLAAAGAAYRTVAGFAYENASVLNPFGRAAFDLVTRNTARSGISPTAARAALDAYFDLIAADRSRLIVDPAAPGEGGFVQNPDAAATLAYRNVLLALAAEARFDYPRDRRCALLAEVSAHFDAAIAQRASFDAGPPSRRALADQLRAWAMACDSFDAAAFAQAGFTALSPYGGMLAAGDGASRDFAALLQDHVDEAFEWANYADIFASLSTRIALLAVALGETWELEARTAMADAFAQDVDPALNDAAFENLLRRLALAGGASPVEEGVLIELYWRRLEGLSNRSAAAAPDLIAGLRPLASHLARSAAARGDAERTFQWLRQALINDLALAFEARQGLGLTAKLAETRDARGLADRVGRLTSIRENIARQGQRVVADERELVALTAEIEQTQATLAALGPTRAWRDAPRELPLERVVEALKPNDALIVLHLTETALIGFAANADGETAAWVQPVSEAALEETVAAARRLLGAVDEDGQRAARGGASTLETVLLAKARPIIEGRSSVHIATDGALNALPFGLLPSPTAAGSSYAATVAYSRLPSIDALTDRLEAPADPRAQTATLRFLGVGDPTFTGASGSGVTLRAIGSLERGFDPALVPALPETRGELSAIAETIAPEASELWFGDEASEARLKAADLSQFRVLSFATHGVVSGELDGRVEPGLLLTPPAEPSVEDDGYLTAREIAALKLDADLVILSACNTAAGGEGEADGFSGLTQAFFEAGARAVLVTHAAIPSDSAVVLTTTLVQKWSDAPDDGWAEALRSTKAQMAAGAFGAAFAEPRHWAAYEIVGVD